MRSFVVAALCLQLAFTALGSAGTFEECKEKGFMQGDLMCSSCGLIKDEELIEDCQKCCTHAVKYRSAILEVCPMKLSRLPEIKAFLEDSAHKYQRLKVRTPLNASPRLRLTQEDGSSDSIRVDLWKKTALEDFFSARMLPS